MKRIGLIVGVLLVSSVAGLVLYQIWPKYGICLETTRYDEIVCVARRNLHFSAHFSWSFNTVTVEAVMAEVRRDDIPVLVDMLGDKKNRAACPGGQYSDEIWRGWFGQPETGRGVGRRHHPVHGQIRTDGL